MCPRVLYSKYPNRGGNFQNSRTERTQWEVACRCSRFYVLLPRILYIFFRIWFGVCCSHPLPCALLAIPLATCKKNDYFWHTQSLVLVARLKPESFALFILSLFCTCSVPGYRELVHHVASNVRFFTWRAGEPADPTPARLGRFPPYPDPPSPPTQGQQYTFWTAGLNCAQARSNF